MKTIWIVGFSEPTAYTEALTGVHIGIYATATFEKAIEVVQQFQQNDFSKVRLGCKESVEETAARFRERERWSVFPGFVLTNQEITSDTWLRAQFVHVCFHLLQFRLADPKNEVDELYKFQLDVLCNEGLENGHGPLPLFTDQEEDSQ